MEVVLDIQCKDWGGIQVVYWDVEEFLNLCGVQVQCQNVVYVCFGQQVCDQFGVDWCVGFGVVVLLGIVEIGDDGGDVVC